MAAHPEIESDARILVAVSGGPDSVALLHVLHRLGFKVGVAHCDFQLRPEAGEEAEFVQGLTEKLGVPFHLEVCETVDYASEKGISIQVAARELRYAFFA
ncbi:MAG: ATP-binding protein, partial [Bacteroidota bacterium]